MKDRWQLYFVDAIALRFWQRSRSYDDVFCDGLVKDVVVGASLANSILATRLKNTGQSCLIFLLYLFKLFLFFTEKAVSRSTVKKKDKL